ncbi:MAG: Hsp20/alpha crystallin family protein [Planctomycetes bacterium]|nr:Hsp20/alpha crystallin family protein [Planctomycetota bacterium]
MFYGLIPWGWKKDYAPTRQTGLAPFDSLDRLFDSFFEDLSPLRWTGRNSVFADSHYRPVVRETEQEIIVSANLPGVEEKDLKVSLKDNTLSISGKGKSEREFDTPNGKLTESSSQSFSQAIPLPKEIDAEKVDATLVDGKLTVTIPKLPPQKDEAHRIKIERN